MRSWGCLDDAPMMFAFAAVGEGDFSKSLPTGVLPKCSYGRYLWAQRSSRCMAITKHFLHSKQMGMLRPMAQSATALVFV